MIKIRASSIIKLLLLFAVLVMIGAFLMIPTELVGKYIKNLIVAMLGIVLSIITYLISGKDVKKGIKECFRYIIPLLSVVLISLYLTKKYYHYSYRELIIVLTPYLYVMYSIPILYVLIYDKSKIKLLHWICYLVTIMLAIRMISSFLYNYSDRIVFERLLFQYDTWIRNGLQRVEAGALYPIATLLMLYQALRYKYKKVFYFAYFFMLLFLVLVSMTRYQLVSTIIASGVLLFFAYPKGNKKTLIRGAVVIAIILLILSGLVERAVELFSVNNTTYGVSTSVRVEDVEHYYSLMRDRKAYFGLGLIDSTNPNARILIRKNIWRDYYLDDIGILGGFVRFGIMGFIVYGTVFISAIKTCIECYKKKSHQSFAICVALTTYMIVSCLLLNIFDNQRAFDVPFYIAVFSYFRAYSNPNSNWQNIV